MSRIPFWCAALAVAIVVVSAASAGGADPVITSGPPPPFPRNAQTELAIAVDPMHADILAAGANDYIQQKFVCHGTQCEFNPKIGISGVYFSFNGNTTEWQRPKYLTLPGYTGLGLATRGDPTLAFGPAPLASGGFSWAAGSRLYYGTMAASYKAKFRVIAVSATSDVKGAAASASKWDPPSVVSPKKGFADKPAIWADDAGSSPNFGYVYACWVTSTTDKDETATTGTPNSILFSFSRDAGRKWARATSLPSPRSAHARQGCAIRTDSLGNVYVAWEEYSPSRQMISVAKASAVKSAVTRVPFSPATPIASVTDIGGMDSRQNRRTIDGVAGARANSWLSLAVANGAPTGADATNTIVAAWASGKLNEEQVLVTYTTPAGVAGQWSTPVRASLKGDRSDMPAVAISPNGTTLYLAYTSFEQNWLGPTVPATTPRMMHGVFLSIPFAAFKAQPTTLWKKEAVTASSDARASSNEDVTAEFIGDYGTMVATRAKGHAAFTFAPSTNADCPDVDTARISGHRFPANTAAKKCPSGWGNTDGFGVSSG
jgi:hypothetical protein